MGLSTEFIVAVLSALGVGAIIPRVVSGIMAYFTGRQAKERAAWIAADIAERERREWEVWGHEVRIIAIKHGIELPDTPKSKDLE